MPSNLGHLVGTAFTAALVLFMIYRRFRRNFGRQPLKRSRLVFRLVVLSAVGLLLLPFAFLSLEQALISGAGLAAGIGLAVWGASHTRFETKDGQLYYIPHTYAGMVVTALFLGRLAYRFVVLSPVLFSTVAVNGQNAAPPDLNGFNGISHNPVTRAVFFVLIGYYVCYYGYVLWESKHLKPGDYEKSPAP